MYPDSFPKTGRNPNSPAAPATAEDLERDSTGYTAPNLHRRIDPSQPSEGSGEVSPRTYVIQISGVCSYRTTQLHVHDEDSRTSEVP